MFSTSDTNISQDWLYEDGEDTTKAVYVAKMDEIRALAGPVFQKHFEKVEAERQASQARADAARAAKEEEARKQAEAQKAAEAANKGSENKDAEMADAKPEVEEAGDPE